jgi:hypothetical protein
MASGPRRNEPRRPTPLGRRRLSAVRAAPEERIGGRAWINGREVGGTDPRHAALHRSYD